MTGPTVSVVTPSYNQAAFLEETLRSVLDQDYPSLEYIVVDDGSTDESPEIVRRYADRLAWWTQQPNAGQVAAINRGFEHSTGEIMAYLNSDDTLLSGAVTALVAELQSDPQLVLVYGDALLTDERSEEVGYLAARPWDVARMVTACDNHVPQPSAFWTRRAWDAVGPMNEAGFYFFDFEFFLRVGSLGRVKRVSQPFSTYRLHADSKTMGAPIGKARDYVRFADSFLASPDLPQQLRPYARRGRASAYAAAGDYYYSELELGRARRLLWKSLVLGAASSSRRTAGLAFKSLLPKAAVSRLRERRGRAGRV